MNNLDAALAAARAHIPQCVASGYVDLSIGVLRRVDAAASHRREVLELVAAVTADLLQGPNEAAIGALLKRAGGATEGTTAFEEILVTSHGLLHIFMRTKRYPDHAVVFVCETSVNLGKAIAWARLVTPRVDAAA